MSLFTLEHSRWAYREDFALYGTAVAVFAAFLLVAGPRELRLEIWALALLGLASWSAIEYALHRFVLHGLQPFQHWHAQHHHRGAPGCYGVTSGFWDQVFRGTALLKASPP
jgi:sterol desaturase/sphingolipid hydroxylase (fatty acid hydroxylase superfamily)